MMHHVLIPVLVAQGAHSEESSNGTFWCMSFSVGIVNTLQ